MNGTNWMDWILRVVKGIFIGSGFILPGISGGALAAVFGIYERMIGFLANLTRDFKKNVLFFLPVIIGMAVGVFLLSIPISALLENKDMEAYVLWFFIGCILGTLPALLKQAGKKGREGWHWALLVVVCGAAYILLRILEKSGAVSLPQSIFTWVLAGVLIGLGAVVPGLSPSNLLMYLKLDQGGQLYAGMTEGIKSLDLSVIIPLVLGALACVLLLSKLMNYIFGRAYATLYHAILGFVLASTLIIVPWNFNYLGIGGLICLGACAAGAVLAFFMSRLEDKYKPEE
jgi:putative membrane protein